MVRFIVRDFQWDEDALEKQNKQLAALQTEEKELWVSLFIHLPFPCSMHGIVY